MIALTTEKVDERRTGEDDIHGLNTVSANGISAGVSQGPLFKRARSLRTKLCTLERAAGHRSTVCSENPTRLPNSAEHMLYTTSRCDAAVSGAHEK